MSTHIFPLAGPIDPLCALCGRKRSDLEAEARDLYRAAEALTEAQIRALRPYAIGRDVYEQALYGDVDARVRCVEVIRAREKARDDRAKGRPW